MEGFLTFKRAWPWPWPWIGSYCIPSCIIHRPVCTCQISLKSKKLFVHGRTDGHLRPALLGWLCRRVDLKSRMLFLCSSQNESTVLSCIHQLHINATTWMSLPTYTLFQVQFHIQMNNKCILSGLSRVSTTERHHVTATNWTNIRLFTDKHKTRIHHVTRMIVIQIIFYTHTHTYLFTDNCVVSLL